MLIKCLTSFCSVICLVFCTASYADDKELTVRMLPFPPLSYMDDDKVTKGYIVDIIRRVLARANKRADIRTFPLARIKFGLNDKSIDLSFISKNMQAEGDSYHMVDEPILSVTLNAYYTDKYKGKAPTKLSDFKGYHVLVPWNYTLGGGIKYIKDPKNDIVLSQPKSSVFGIKMLMKGRGDFLLEYAYPFQVSLTELNIKDRNLFNSSVLQVIDVYMVYNYVKDVDFPYLAKEMKEEMLRSMPGT